MLVKVSLLLPKCVEVSAFSIFIVLSALVLVCFMCSLYVSLGSCVSPRILGLLVVGRMVWSIVRFRLLLYSAGSGVNRVVQVLLALSCMSLSFVHSCMSCRKGWSLCSAVR